MKPFWKKHGKKKSNSKPRPAAQRPAGAPRSRPEPWKPPERSKPEPWKPQKRADVVSRPGEPRSDDNSGAEFVGGQARKDFIKTFKQLSYRYHKWQIWTDFVTMCACSISNAVDKSHYDKREEQYFDIIKKYNKKERECFPELFAHTVMALEENPDQDFLGSIYMELNLADDGKKQIFTPYSVCQLMTELTSSNLVKEIEEQGFVTVHDPCCGAGATLIAGANDARRKLEKVGLNFQNHILFTGQDIEPIVTMMCYIQMSLLGTAGYFKIGNSFTEPMTDNDTLENYWFTPMYFSSVWAYRRIFRQMDALMQKGGVKVSGQD